MQTYDDPDGPDRSGQDEPELIGPEDFLPPDPFPLDARRLGFDRYTGDGGALIGLAAALDGTRTSHRVIAWVLLAVVVGPFVMNLWTQLGLAG